MEMICSSAAFEDNAFQEDVPSEFISSIIDEKIHRRYTNAKHEKTR